MKKIILYFFLVAGLMWPTLNFAQDEKVLLILPFKVNADRDLNYLSGGLQDMLISRLTHPKETRVVQKEILQKELSKLGSTDPFPKATELGKALGADYVIGGTIVVLGNSFSLDAAIRPTKEGVEGFSVSTQGKKLDDLIIEMDKFASEINARIFGKKVAKTEAVSEEREGQEAEEEKAWAPHPQFKAFRYGLDQKNYWRSRGFQDEISGLDIGDVDGDGQNEVVLSLKDKVEVYKFKDKRLTKFAEYSFEDRIPIISLDVADINKNNRAEIFVSRVSGGYVNSAVLEYTNGRLGLITKDSPYLFKVMDLPPHGKTLIGQRMSTGHGEAVADVIRYYFSSDIEKLEWTGKDYQGAGSLPLPNIKGLFLYNFTMADLDNDGSPEIIMIDQEEKLSVYSNLGERLFRSSETFGTTLNYIRLNPEKESSISRVRLEINDVYLPPRMIVADIDGDGKKELIVIKNTSSSPYTSRYKAFSDGKIVLLSWSGMALDPVWETRRLTGCISDFQIKDLDGDGNLDLVLAVIQDTEVKLMKDARSVIVGYSLAKQK